MTTYTKEIGSGTIVLTALGELEVRVTPSDIDSIRIEIPGCTLFVKVEHCDALAWAIQEAACKVREALEPIQF